MTFTLTCLECKNEIDLENFLDQLEVFIKGDFEEEDDLIIECNHCATDHLVLEVSEEGVVKAEIIERDK